MATRSRGAIAGLLAGPAALALAGMLVNGFNLLMNLVLARVLDPAEYGAVVVQVSIFMILSVVGNALLIAVVQRETAGHGDGRRAQWAWIRRLRGVCGAGIVVASVVAVLLCRPAAALLSYSHPLAVAEAVVGAAVWTLLCVERGVLQARGAYQRLAVNFVFEGAARIGLVVVLVALGFGVNGAGLGLMLGIALGAEHARSGVARVPRPAPERSVRLPVPVSVSAPGAGLPGPTPGPLIGPTPLPTSTGPLPIPGSRRPGRTGLVTDTWVALGALVPLALLQNMDVVIVGWLDHDGVGSYAAISTACKVPVFIGLAVANFLLPEAARRRAAGRGAAGTLAVALAFVIAPGLALAGIGLVAAGPVLSMVFGPDLAGASSSLSVLALGMTCLAVTLMFTTYLLGASERRVVGVLATCSVLTAAGLGLAGGSAARTAVAGLACHAVTAVAVGALVRVLHRADGRAGQAGDPRAAGHAQAGAAWDRPAAAPPRAVPAVRVTHAVQDRPTGAPGRPDQAAVRPDQAVSRPTEQEAPETPPGTVRPGQRPPGGEARPAGAW